MSTIAETSETALKDGRIVAIIGPVVDVEFPPDALPEINWALEFETDVEGEVTTIIAEVAQHIGENRVRAIAMKPTDGLKRGQVVRNLGRGIEVPVGPATLGHVFNVIGEPLDTKGKPIEGLDERWEIHRPPPPFEELEPPRKMLSTNSSTSWFITSRKYSAMVSADSPTRSRTPGGSSIWP